MSKAIPLETIEARISAIDQEKAEHQCIVQELEYERRMLVRIRGDAVEFGGESAQDPQRRGRNTSELIRQFVANNPGASAAAVADRLVGEIETKSPERRRVVMNTLFNLVKRGKLRKDDDGRLWQVNGDTLYQKRGASE